MHHIHEPIKYTNRNTKEDRKLGRTFIIFFSILTVVPLVCAVYTFFAFNQGYIASIFLVLISVFFSLGIFVFHYGTVYKDHYTFDFELDESGIHEWRENVRAGQQQELHIPFEQMDEVIIANYTTPVSVPRNRGYYLHHAILLIRFQKDQFYLKPIKENHELDDWVARFRDKERRIVSSDYDLRPALAEFESVPLNFSGVEGLPLGKGGKLPSLGEESASNPFDIWMPPNEKELKKITVRGMTVKREKQVLLALFFYAMLFGGLVMPFLPLDEEQVFEITMTVWLAGYGVYLFIPVVFAYPRQKTSWYLPFLCFLVVCIGNAIGLFVATMFLDLPSLYFGVFAINLVYLFLIWNALFVVKFLLFIYHLVTDK